MSDSEPPHDGTPNEAPTQNLAKAKRWRLTGLVISSIAFGVAEQLFVESHADERAFAIGGMVVGLLLIVSWCRLDARERAYTISKPLLLTIILLAGVGLPVYLLRTRGVRGILSIVIALLFGLLLTALEQVAIEITFYLM